MKKLVMMSLLILTIVVPLYASRNPSALRGMRNAIVGMVAVIVLYVFAVLHVVPRLPG